MILAVMYCYVTWVVSAEHCSMNCLYISNEENESDTCSDDILAWRLIMKYFLQSFSPFR